MIIDDDANVSWKLSEHIEMRMELNLRFKENRRVTEDTISFYMYTYEYLHLSVDDSE